MCNFPFRVWFTLHFVEVISALFLTEMPKVVHAQV